MAANDYLPSTRKIINDTGDRDIRAITIGRTPLAKAMTLALNAVSLGSFNRQLKETPADTLFHLFMVVETEHGKYVLEKNAVISMKRYSGIPAGSETMDVAVNKDLTLEDALAATQRRMGNKFFTYKGLDNNCQYFVSSFLKANGLNTAENISFVVQETRKLFDNNPKFRKIVNSITDVGAVAENVKEKVEGIVRKPATDAIKAVSDAVVKPVQNEIMKPLYRSLTLANQIGRAITNPFARK